MYLYSLLLIALFRISNTCLIFESVTCFLLNHEFLGIIRKQLVSTEVIG